MFEALIVTLREGIEAALVVGIILIYLRKTGREALSRWVYAGLATGVVGALGCAGAFAALEVEEEAYEGWLMLLGSIFVAGTVLWMMRTSKRLKGEIEARLDSIASHPKTNRVAWGLFGLTFILVLREGIETVLFLAAVDLTTDSLLSFVGGVVGVILAVLFGVAFVRGTVPIDLPRFFKVTAVILFVLAAQLFIGGIHEFGERGTIPLGRREMLIIGPLVKNDVLVLLSLLALPLVFLMIPGRKDNAKASEASALSEGPARRLAVSRIRRERLWRTTFAVAGIVVLASLTVSYAFSRLPRAIDPPKVLEADVGGSVHVPKLGLDDGHLHRFGVPVRGTIVRFFVIKAGSKLVPVLDACQVCGAYGYVESKGHLVCLACAADVNPTTVGMGGGCNPIPLAYRDDGKDLILDTGELATKAPLFQESEGSAPAPPKAG